MTGWAGAAFVWDIKSQSVPLWAWCRVLQAISRGSLLGANLHVYFPRTPLGRLNGLGPVPNSSSSELHFFFSPSVIPVYNQPCFSKRREPGFWTPPLLNSLIHEMYPRKLPSPIPHLWLTLNTDRAPLNLAWLEDRHFQKCRNHSRQQLCYLGCMQDVEFLEVC
jgi:hypothetical protein